MKNMFLLLGFCTLYLSQTAAQKMENCDDIVEKPAEQAYLPAYQQMNAYDRWFFSRRDMVALIHDKLGPLDISYSGKALVLRYVVDQAGMLRDFSIEKEEDQTYLPLLREVLSDMPPLQPAMQEGQAVCSQQSILIPLTHLFDSLLQQELTIVPYQPPLYRPSDCAAPTPEAQKECGQKTLLADFYKRIIYPARAIERGVDGTVLIQFVIDKNGQAVHHRIVRDLEPGCGQAALRSALQLTEWVPGRDENGELVNVQVTLPVRFKLVGPEPEKKKKSKS